MSPNAILYAPGMTVTVSDVNSTGAVVAASCERDDVAAAVEVAANGNTVLVPAGTAAWTGPVTITGKALTLRGAGIGQTTIIDAVPKPANGRPPGHVLIWNTIDGLISRLTGFTFDGGAGTRDPFNKSVVQVGGTSKQLRIDHVRFVATRTSVLTIGGWIHGVIDHCLFDLQGQRLPLYIHHSDWNGIKDFGDGSWADELHLGTDQAIFVEDNDVVAAGDALCYGLDGWMGHRVVYRHNRLVNVKLANHGSDSAGRGRGARSYEIYNNIFTYNGLSGAWDAGIEIRSGNGVIYGNQLTGAFTGLGGLHYYRDADASRIWRLCDGTSDWDWNDPAVHATGSHTGANNVKVLTDSSKAWIPQQWYGYSVHNTTRGGSSVILANTATTIDAKFVGQYELPRWNTGDQYAIRRALAGMDQVGRGKGVLLTGTSPSPVGWPQQMEEPMYCWNNIVNGQVMGIQSGSPFIKEGRDFKNIPMPGYIPYVYPHPLTYVTEAP